MISYSLTGADAAKEGARRRFAEKKTGNLNKSKQKFPDIILSSFWSTNCSGKEPTNYWIQLLHWRGSRIEG